MYRQLSKLAGWPVRPGHFPDMTTYNVVMSRLTKLKRKILCGVPNLISTTFCYYHIVVHFDASGNALTSQQKRIERRRLLVFRQKKDRCRAEKSNDKFST